MSLYVLNEVPLFFLYARIMAFYESFRNYVDKQIDIEKLWFLFRVVKGHYYLLFKKGGRCSSNALENHWTGVRVQVIGDVKIGRGQVMVGWEAPGKPVIDWVAPRVPLWVPHGEALLLTWSKMSLGKAELQCWVKRTWRGKRQVARTVSNPGLSLQFLILR